MEDGSQANRIQASATTILAAVAALTALVGVAFWAGTSQGDSTGTDQVLQSEIEDETHQREAADRDILHQHQALKDAFTDYREMNTGNSALVQASIQQILVAVERLTIQVEGLTSIAADVVANTQAIIEIRAQAPSLQGQGQ